MSRAIAGDEAASRAQALTGLVAGAGIFIVVAAAVLFVSRYITVLELRRGLAGMVRALRSKVEGSALP